MKWFKEVFLQSFIDNFNKNQLNGWTDDRISKKQFGIFMKYLSRSFDDGLTEGKFDFIDGKKIRAYIHHSVYGDKYYVCIEQLSNI